MIKKYIVLHHSATPDNIVLKDFDAIKRHHLSKGWRDIGYHWVVEKVDGRLVALKGRDESDIGAHCIPRNKDGIGICIVGNFEVDNPTPELYKFVANLCKDIITRHPIQEIGGHRNYDATACPGRNFNLDRLRNLVSSMDDKNRTPCTIDIKGQKFPGYLQGGKSYFGEGVAVTDVVEAINAVVVWDEKALTVKIS